MRNTAYGTMEAIIWWEPPKRAKDLHAYRSALSAQADPRLQYKRAMDMERLIGLYTTDQISTKQMPAGAMGIPETNLTALFIGAERECLEQTYEQLTAENADLLDEKGFLEVVDQNRAGTAILASLLIPVTGKALERFKRAEERRRICTVALSFLEYRIVYGKDPAALDDLVPAFLKELPVDVTAAQLPRMRVDEKGIIAPNRFQPDKKLPPRGPGLIRLYYLGTNQQDDGGLNHWSDDAPSQNAPNERDDIVIRVPPQNWKPEEWPTPESLGAPKRPAPQPQKGQTTKDKTKGDGP